MAPAPDDDQFVRLGEMINSLEQAIRLHRDIVFRSISQLNIEVIGFRSELDQDKADRTVRQKEVDAKLARITRWQMIRLVVEVIALLILVYYLGGR